MNDDAILQRARAAGIAVDWIDAIEPAAARFDRVAPAHPRRAASRPVARGPAAADGDSRASRSSFPVWTRKRRPSCMLEGESAHDPSRSTPPVLPASSGPATTRCASAVARSRSPSRRRAASPSATSRRANGSWGLAVQIYQPAARRRSAASATRPPWPCWPRRPRTRAPTPGAQPGAQPLSRRSDALRSLLAIQPPVPQSAADRSRHRARRAARRRSRRPNSTAPLIDWPSAARRKYALLRRLYDNFLTTSARVAGSSTPSCATGGASLAGHIRFEGRKRRSALLRLPAMAGRRRLRRGAEGGARTPACASA